MKNNLLCLYKLYAVLLFISSISLLIYAIFHTQLRVAYPFYIAMLLLCASLVVMRILLTKSPDFVKCYRKKELNTRCNQFSIYKWPLYLRRVACGIFAFSILLSLMIDNMQLYNLLLKNNSSPLLPASGQWPEAGKLLIIASKDKYIRMVHIKANPVRS